MANLKVTSKRFNEKDVLEVNDQDFAEAVQKAPVFEVSNIKALTAEQLDSLKCGDIVAKKTGKQKHAYVVSYKGEGAGQGICLTYTDASTVETVSYDRSGSGWVYNSTDVTPIPTEESIQSMIEADKDVISKIEMVYEDGYTYIYFPARVMPLSITFNTHELFFKNGKLVDYDGQEVEGYEYDDFYIDSSNQCILTVVEDISEQVINNLVYVLFNGLPSQPLRDTYSLFFPTRLYLHTFGFSFSGESGTGKFGHSGPIYIVSTQGSAYTLSGLPLFVSQDGIISMSDDDAIIGGSISYDENNTQIITTDALGGEITFNNVDDFSDDVTEI